MNRPAAHSVPVFEGRASRRHQPRTAEQLRSEASDYAASGAGPDLAALQTVVQFAGFPRSGHSLVGSLIDAHPDAVVAHELDLMGLVALGLDRSEIFSLVCANSADFERHGRYWNGYGYHVPAGTGGASTRPLVLGDKKADWAVRRFLGDPGLLDTLQDRLGGLRAAWVLVLRNPFDNIATLSLRKGRAYDRIRIAARTPEELRRELEAAQGDGVAAEVLPEMIDDYASLCEGVARIVARVPPADLLELRHEDLVASPEAQLERLLTFAGLSADPGFVRDAASAVSRRTNRTRHQVRWPREARERVERLTREHRFLAGYAFDDD